MGLVHEANARGSEPQIFPDLSCLYDRAIEVPFIERIAKARLELRQHIRTGMERHRTRHGLRDRPKLIDPVAMVTMRVSHDHAVEAADAGGQQLLT